MVIRARIIRIGNSRALRLSRQLLDQVALGDDVELHVQPDGLLIRPVQHPRAGWDEQLRAMAEQGDDRLLDGDQLEATRWDQAEWRW